MVRRAHLACGPRFKRLLMMFRSGAKVTLFERDPQAGGHTLTDDSPGHPVDLGFQVRLAIRS